MVVFLIHWSRAKGRALGRGHSILLHPQLGTLVIRDTLVLSDPFVLPVPPHTPFCIHQDRLILCLHPGMPAVTVLCPSCMFWAISHVWRCSKSRVNFYYPLLFIFSGAGCEHNKVWEEDMTMLLQKLFWVNMEDFFHCPPSIFSCATAVCSSFTTRWMVEFL